MDPFFIKAIQLFLSLSILIVLHELGHFIPAKIFKTRVEKFFLFFDVKFALFKKKIGDTVYGIGWLPLGGYVKIAGMIDESMDKEQMAQPPQPWEFRSKPAWQRLIIMLGGVTVNIVLGFVIYMMLLYGYGRSYVSAENMPDGFAVSEVMQQYGFQDGDRVLGVNGEKLKNTLDINKYLMMRDVENVTVLRQDGSMESITIPEDIGPKLFESGVMIPFQPRQPSTLDSILPNSPAQEAGLKTGDRILTVNGEPVQYWDEFTNQVKENRGNEMSLLVERNAVDRNGITENITVTPTEEGTIGVMKTSMPNITVEKENFSLGESVQYGFSHTYWQLHDYVAQFKYVFTPKGATQVGGFGAIGGLFPDAWDWQRFWETTAFISIILAFMNILPIPALDGGHVMFLLYEMITGRKPNEKFLEYAQMVGFFLLIALVLFANGNDIYRWLFK